MIEYFTSQLVAFWAWFLPFFQTLIWPGVAVTAVLLAARIVATRLDQVSGSSLEPQLRSLVLGATKVLVILCTLGLFVTVQRAGLRSVTEYAKHQAVKRFDSKEVVSGGPINQNMPTVNLLVTEKHKTSRVFNTQELDQYRLAEKVDYVQLLRDRGLEEPEIVDVALIANGQVRVVAQYQTVKEQSVTLTGSTIEVSLDPVLDADRRANAYQLTYGASFQWKNATDSPAATRFQFVLPDHGGTINDVKVAFGDAVATGSNEDGLISYDVNLSPGQTATARIAYNTKGRGNFRFYPSSGLRMIPSLEMNLRSTAQVRFERGTMVPENLGQGRYRWALKNAVTRQYVSIGIPFARGTQELWWKLGYTAPLALLVFSGALFFLGFLSRPLPILVGAVLAQGVGTSISLAFSSFDTSPILLGLLGSCLSGALVIWILGKKSWIAVGSSSAVYLSAIAGSWTVGLIFLGLLALAAGLGRSSTAPEAS